MIAPLVLAGWIGTMAAVTFLTDAAPASVVVIGKASVLDHLPDGTAVLGAGPMGLTLANEMEGFGPALYRAGALLVLPAGLAGCLPLPRDTRARLSELS